MTWEDKHQSVLTFRMGRSVWGVIVGCVDSAVPAPLRVTVVRNVQRNDGLVINEAVRNCTILHPGGSRHPNLKKFLRGCAGCSRNSSF
jgi:hypothetical protein